MNEENYKNLRNFVEREIANSDDAYQLTVEETHEIFKQSIQAVEEVTGKEIDGDKFNEFLNFYKIMKVVEKISEELRTDKYLKDMQERRLRHE